MYHDDMLDKSEYELAEKYRISETKALRLKLEFDKRWLDDQKKSFENIVAGIGKHIFEDRTIELSRDESQKNISFMLTDPYELQCLKRALEFNGIPYTGNFVRSLVTLQQEKFIAIFFKYYPGLKETLTPFLAGDIATQAERNAILDKAVPLSQKAWKILKQIAPKAIEAVLTFAIQG
ncbi:hypothetical protein AGMMS49944_24970 [Spirochaetia bacterium]|nr:hypothetical protein AGMMS49944_24970 [Spirochaetia bacterium]